MKYKYSTLNTDRNPTLFHKLIIAGDHDLLILFKKKSNLTSI